MARQDSYSNDVQITGTDRVTGIDGTTGRTNNFLFSTISSFIGAQFSISGNTITLPDGRTFDTGITSLLGVSLINLPTTEPSTAGLPWRQGQILKISGQSTDSLEVVSTGAGNGAGPLIDLYRNSSSPATSDIIGGVRFSGNNSTGVKTNYGQVNATIDTTSGNSSIVIAPSTAGVPTSAVTISGSSTSVNNTLVASGQTIFSNPSITLAALPTTDPGISNRLWNDGGTPVLSGSTAAPVVSTSASAITIDGITTNYPGNTGGEANEQSDWNETTTTDDSYIQNKPRIELSGTTNVIAGGVTVNDLPTSDPGTTNRLWNDGGVIRISGTATVSTTVAELAGEQTFTDTKTFNTDIRFRERVNLSGASVSHEIGFTSGGSTSYSRIYGEGSALGNEIVLSAAAGSQSGSVAAILDSSGGSGRGLRLTDGNFVLPNTGSIIFGTIGSGGFIVFPAPPGPRSKSLNDYEEGTWAPIMANTTFTNAVYTKVGDVVHIEIVLAIATNTSSVNAEITGLIYSVAGSAAMNITNIGATSTDHYTAFVSSTDDTISILRNNARATIGSLSGTSTMIISGTYRTNE